MTESTTPSPGSSLALRVERIEAQPLRELGDKSGLVGGTKRAFADIWKRRELLRLLINRELKARYKDSNLGFVWSLFKPLSQLLIYFIVIGQFLGASRGIPSFAIFVFTGLTAWGFFLETVTGGTGSIVANSGLVKKVYLPREIFPLSTLGTSAVNSAIQLVILLSAIVVTVRSRRSRSWPTCRSLSSCWSCTRPCSRCFCPRSTSTCATSSTSLRSSRSWRSGLRRSSTPTATCKRRWL